MRLLQYIVTTSVFIIISCDNKRDKQSDAQQSIPEAMEETKGSSILSKRTPDDPVNTIYMNLVDKSVELKRVEEWISKIHDDRDDSTALLMDYLERNEQYYKSAQRHILSITDSALRNRILRLMDTSKSDFDVSINGDRNLLNSIDSTIKQINNQREMLKVLLTMSVIEEYQRLNKPSSNPANNFEKELDTLKAKINSIIKKNGG